MTRRCVAFTGVVGVILVVAWLVPVVLTAQGRSAAPAASNGAPAKAWTARTPDGQPDLQGFWTNSTYTPLQRPDTYGEFFTQEQAIEMMKRAAAEESEQTEPGTIADVHYDFTQFGLDRNQGGVPLNLRTSLIIDPANGKLPAMTPEGQKRAADRLAARKRQGALTDAAENQPNSVRCILMDRNGPPMIPGAYNNFYQIIQGPGYVMILVEMLHGTRIIPIDGATPQLPPTVRTWTGHSRGRWEGDTLVIETTNFNEARFSGFAANSPMAALQGSSENLKLIERIKRLDADTLDYAFTVEDPATWTRPWTAHMPWKNSTGPIFEHACHEGNYGLHNTLAGARLEDKQKAEAAAKGTRQQ